MVSVFGMDTNNKRNFRLQPLGHFPGRGENLKTGSVNQQIKADKIIIYCPRTIFKVKYLTSWSKGNELRQNKKITL